MFDNPKVVFEMLMLICFGLGWPVSIAKSLRTRFVRGKSVMFMCVVLTGYTAGFIAKVCRGVQNGEPPHWLAWFYLGIFCLVATDLFLYFRFRHNQEAVTETLAHEIADIAEIEEEETAGL